MPIDRHSRSDCASARPALRLAAALGSLLLLAACASNDTVDLTLDSTPPDKLYNEGLALIDAGKVSSAAKKFEDVDRLHPYSEWAKKAILMQVFTHYKSGKYADAIQAGKRYVTLFPGSPDAPYALYLVGESYFQQIPDVTRDQAQTEKALAAMSDLIRRWPNSEYANDAKKKIEITKDQLAGREMEIGRYYLSKRQYIAAVNRFRKVITDYQTTRHVEEALARVTESYYAMGVVREAQTAAAVLGHNFPDSRWYKDAYSLLKAGGYEPSEDEGSWISKAFKSVKII